MGAVAAPVGDSFRNKRRYRPNRPTRSSTAKIPPKPAGRSAEFALKSHVQVFRVFKPATKGDFLNRELRFTEQGLSVAQASPKNLLMRQSVQNGPKTLVEMAFGNIKRLHQFLHGQPGTRFFTDDSTRARNEGIVQRG